MTSHTLVVDDLSKVYGTRRKPLRALESVSFEIPAGTATAVLGPNGAGKTTTVRIISTLLKPTSGRVQIGDIDALASPAHARSLIGLSGQYAAVDENLTGAENLRMVAYLYGFNRASAAARATELLEEFRLDDAGSRRVGTYSGGMRRRLDLAAALIARPTLVILDEPTTGLDPQSRKDMWEVINGLKEVGTTVLLTTQYLEEADQLADEIVVIDHGTVIARGTAAELKKSAASDIVELTPARPGDVDRCASIAGPYSTSGEVERVDSSLRLPVARGTQDMIAITVACAEVGVELVHSHTHSPTLDDVFFALTGKDAS